MRRDVGLRRTFSTRVISVWPVFGHPQRVLRLMGFRLKASNATEKLIALRHRYYDIYIEPGHSFFSLSFKIWTTNCQLLLYPSVCFCQTFTIVCSSLCPSPCSSLCPSHCRSLCPSLYTSAVKVDFFRNWTEHC